MKNKSAFRYLLGVAAILAGGVLLGGSSAWGSVCSNCHVMHASQGGVMPAALGGTPQGFLLNNTCLGCHTGTNATDGAAPARPYIYTVGVADLSTSLAGGNFKFADDNDRYGHNPVELTGGVDATLTSPPGKDYANFAANGQVGDINNGVAATKLSCSGTYGCHGTHDANGTKGGHHANATGSLTTADSVGNSYRFLYKIKGYEVNDYEFTPGAADGSHNVYYGKARTADTAADRDNATMSYFCAECHGLFHGDGGTAATDGIAGAAFASPWIRHPVDITMPNAGEYAGYNAYRTDAPVASSSVADNSLTIANAADRIVMCLSCHVAHASPNNYGLRWAYTMDAGAGASTAGCFACHTTKDTP